MFTFKCPYCKLETPIDYNLSEFIFARYKCPGCQYYSFINPDEPYYANQDPKVPSLTIGKSVRFRGSLWFIVIAEANHYVIMNEAKTEAHREVKTKDLEAV